MFTLLGDNAQPHRIGPEMDEVLIKLPRGQLAKFLFQLLMLRLGNVSKCKLPLHESTNHGSLKTGK